MVARLQARALGNLVRAQVQDKLAKEVLRWMAAGVSTAADHTLRLTVRRRVGSTRGASGPSAGCANPQLLTMETANCNWKRSTVVAPVKTGPTSKARVNRWFPRGLSPTGQRGSEGRTLSNRILRNRTF